MFCCELWTFSLPSKAGQLNALIKDHEGDLLEDAVVTATPLDLVILPKNNSKNQEVDQVRKEFTPYVKPIYINTWVLFPNNDDIRHHVYSFSPAKKFELPLYSGLSAPPVLFDKPGVVVLGCNIHDWMVGYIYVSDTPYYAKSGGDGRVNLAEIPNGEYLVKVWHPRMQETQEATMQRIIISNANPSNLEWQLQLKPPFKIPRTAANHGFGYR